MNGKLDHDEYEDALSALLEIGYLQCQKEMGAIRWDDEYRLNELEHRISYALNIIGDSDYARGPLEMGLHAIQEIRGEY